MEKATGKNLSLMAIGAFLLGASLILKQYVSITDSLDGLLKGISIGLMILGLLPISRKQSNKTI